jgi:hypothetical protein
LSTGGFDGVAAPRPWGRVTEVRRVYRQSAFMARRGFVKDAKRRRDFLLAVAALKAAADAIDRRGGLATTLAATWALKGDRSLRRLLDDLCAKGAIDEEFATEVELALAIGPALLASRSRATREHRLAAELARRLGGIPIADIIAAVEPLFPRHLF